jgi:hypothetical protein
MFPSILGFRKFITVFTRARHYTLSKDNLLHFTFSTLPTNLLEIDHLGDKGEATNVKAKWIFDTQNMKMWGRWNWLITVSNHGI